MRGIRSCDAVQHGAVGRLLDETGDLVLLDGESLPVDNGIGAVGHVKCLWVGIAETCLPVNHLGTLGIGIGADTCEQPEIYT